MAVLDRSLTPMQENQIPMTRLFRHIVPRLVFEQVMVQQASGARPAGHLPASLACHLSPLIDEAAVTVQVNLLPAPASAPGRKPAGRLPVQLLLRLAVPPADAAAVALPATSALAAEGANHNDCGERAGGDSSGQQVPGAAGSSEPPSLLSPENGSDEPIAPMTSAGGAHARAAAAALAAGSAAAVQSQAAAAPADDPLVARVQAALDAACGVAARAAPAGADGALLRSNLEDLVASLASELALLLSPEERELLEGYRGLEPSSQALFLRLYFR